ncbi:MAG: protocatechuate 3,4-dioxygenase [Burkholderiaceae bacterium]
MAKLVAAFGSSHSIMLVARREDWQTGFREADRRNPFLYDHSGEHRSYDELLAVAPADAESVVTPEKMSERFDRAEAAMDALAERIARARLDVLLIVGDDQTELFRTTNNPAIAIYYGETIRNARAEAVTDDTPWPQRARMRRLEPDADRHYPVDAPFARWLVRELSDRDFDIAAMSGLEGDRFEGHAFSFVHRRLLAGHELPVIPVILNTFDPPNQPTPRRCQQLGAALREAIATWPAESRVGIIASGGLSHFVVDERLDHAVIDAIRTRDRAALASLDPKHLQSGSSEIRNWLVVAEAAHELSVDWLEYVPAYRTPALTGTGLCFAAWA